MSELPRYSVGNRLYLRESAAIGCLEAVWIAGVTQQSGGQWLYSFSSTPPQPYAPPYQGERRSTVTGQSIYMTESEFVDYCEALRLAEQYTQAALARIQSLRAVAQCP